MEVVQALIAIGGKASRIRNAGISVPVSKSFLSLCGRPLLHWNLKFLHAAGIRDIVLCGNNPLQLAEAELLLDRIGVSFSSVHFFQDPGLGVHGLPYQVAHHASDLLKEQIIFECGHSLMEPDHYKRIMHAKTNENVVFSAFKPHPSNPRQPVRLLGNQAELAPPALPAPSAAYALAHPIVIDSSYIERLPSLRFKITEILACYSRRREIRYVFSDMPPEFDVMEEMRAAYARYEVYLLRQGLVQHSQSSAAPR
jgi:hypothetical protein